MIQGTVLEFTHNHGTENDPNCKYNNGNVEPHRGFGHIAFSTNDVYEACQKLEAEGVKFQKKPDEGRMKGLAFVLDPDGYWVEIVKRHEGTGFQAYFNLSQTMMRVKDPAKAIPFYQDILGMTLVRETHFPDAKFSLYFFACLPPGTQRPDPKGPEAGAFVQKLWNPVLELTHNHGTENDPNFKYHNGNDEPKGFGHIAYLVDDVHAACADLEQKGVSFKKKPNEGGMRDIAFVYDPDHYWVEIVHRGLQIKSDWVMNCSPRPSNKIWNKIW